jgi:acyl carrier protein
MNQCLSRQGKPIIQNDGQSLQELGFRSLDFAELALRVEDGLGRELAFDASDLRSIQTVGDVLALFQRAGA